MSALFFVLLTVSSAFSQEYILESVKIFGDQERFEEPGSVYQVDSKTIEKNQTINAHEILKDVPGVTVQEEDGLGLRLNIGLRGATPQRSKKITLMEDGIMIAPAPYSAPAAYYTPLFSKIREVEVYKGPSSIKYGPNSIGGAVNFITRDFGDNESEINYSYGSFNTQRLNAWHKDQIDQFSYLVEYGRLDSDGFKTLSSQDLSFVKNDVLFKARYSLKSEKARVFDFKFNWSNEDSNESYMGTTQADFNSQPYARYRASENDIFNWKHQQYSLKYLHQWSDFVFSDATAYRTNFSRNWSKINGFKDPGVLIQDVLLNPVGQNQDFLAVLKGEKNSAPSEELEYGVNDRDYYSQGLKFNTVYDNMDHLKMELGLLYHMDEVERSHLLQDYSMDSNSGLVSSGPALIDEGNQNVDTAEVFRLYFMNTHKFLKSKKIIFRYGARYEHIKLKRAYKFGGTDSASEENIFVPGTGLTYKFNKNNLAFLGVNLGVTPPSPGQNAGVDPEESINYELGYRYQGKQQSFELIGFYNDYSNILGTCTFSNGCQANALDVQYSGGEALIYGLEMLYRKAFVLGKVNYPFELSSTYTKAEFTSSRESSNAEWGIGVINKGAPLPYIPELSLSASGGIDYKPVSVTLNYKYQSRVYDQSVFAGRREISGFGVWSLLSSYQVNPQLKTYLNVSNLFDKSYVTSLRPFGLRPGAPLWVTAGVSYKF